MAERQKTTGLLRLLWGRSLNRLGTIPHYPAFLAALLLALPGAAHAQAWPPGVICAPRVPMLAQLLRDFGEVAQPTVPAATGSPFILTMGSKSAGERRTWTIIWIRPDGIACVLAAGTELPYGTSL